MLVECIDIKLLKGDSSLKAIAKIKIADWGLIINEVKMFQKDGRYWCSFPDKEYLKEGQKKYFKFLQFEDPEVGKKIMEMAVQCIRQRLIDGKDFHDKQEEARNSNLGLPDF